MAMYGQSPFTREDVPQLIGIKTHVGGFFFDAFLKLDHERRLTITDHPVEEGANITDHAFVEPKAVSIEIGMSDVCASFIDGQFTQRFSRSVSAYDTLEKMQADRIPISIHSKLATYHNMLIENITAPDDYLTRHGLRATIFFREIIVVSTDTVTLPNRTSTAPQKTGNTNRGAVQPTATEDNRSALRRAADSLSGGSMSAL
jgi:hypothetical protein